VIAIAIPRLRKKVVSYPGVGGKYRILQKTVRKGIGNSLFGEGPCSSRSVRHNEWVSSTEGSLDSKLRLRGEKSSEQGGKGRDGEERERDSDGGDLGGPSLPLKGRGDQGILSWGGGGSH